MTFVNVVLSRAAPYEILVDLESYEPRTCPSADPLAMDLWHKQELRRIAGLVPKLLTLTLQPGPNKVSAEELAKLRTNPHVQKLFELGVLQLSSKAAPEPKPTAAEMDTPIDDHSTATALRVVEACDDTAQLKRWLRQLGDHRDTVRAAIRVRLAKLTEQEVDSAPAEHAENAW